MQKAKTTSQNQQGFTLPELLVVILIMGILAAIAIPSWQSVVNSRNVDSGANQVASDLRLLHARSTNRLVNWSLQVDKTAACPGVADSIGRRYRLLSGSISEERCLPSGTKWSTSVTSVAMNSDGTATVVGTGNLGVVNNSGGGLRSVKVELQTAKVGLV